MMSVRELRHALFQIEDQDAIVLLNANGVVRYAEAVDMDIEENAVING